MKDFNLFIIDDEPGLSDLIADIARPIGINCYVFEDPVKAWKSIESKPPDAIVLDLGMPRINGQEFVKKMAKSGYTGIKLLLISGSSLDALDACKQLAVELSMNVVGILTKPMRLKQMHDIFLKMAHTKGSIKSSTPQITTFEDIPKALRVNQIVSLYQPQIDVINGNIVGFEAQMHWNHPQLGLVGPAAFIAQAEADGTIADLSKVFIETIFQDFEYWKEEKNYQISVDISALHSQCDLLPDFLAGLAAINAINTENITLGLTDASALVDPKKWAETLFELHLRGFELSINDFGSGYSSMLEIQTIPFSEIKIDAEIIRKTISDSAALGIVEKAAMSACQIGIKTIAKGVNSKEIFDLISHSGVELCQGNFIGRAMSIESVPSWERSWDYDKKWSRI